jgi:hypothetical protein
MSGEIVPSSSVGAHLMRDKRLAHHVECHSRKVRVSGGPERIRVVARSRANLERTSARATQRDKFSSNLLGAAGCYMEELSHTYWRSW